MKLSDYLKPQNILCNAANIASKKQVLEHISKIACREYEDLNYVEVLQALLKRERLGSTALGHGVAIPHARVPHIDQPVVTLITLQTAISFYEGEPVAVDIIFGILAPEDANQMQLNVLAEIATALQQKSYRDGLRQATGSEALYTAATRLPTKGDIGAESHT